MLLSWANGGRIHVVVVFSGSMALMSLHGKGTMILFGCDTNDYVQQESRVESEFVSVSLPISLDRPSPVNLSPKESSASEKTFTRVVNA